MSVTYGAGGTTQDRTISTLADLREHTGSKLGGHLTCVGRSKAQVHEVVDQYQQMGVSHIVALRGDPPEGTTQRRASPRGLCGCG